MVREKTSDQHPLVTMNENVLVATDSAPIRNMIVTTLRKMGFRSVTSAGDISEAIDNIRSGGVGWMIMSPFADKKYTAISLMRSFIADRNFRKTRTSLLLSEGQEDMLPLAVANGLMSWFTVPMTAQDLIDNVNKLQGFLRENNGDDALFIAQEFRKWLIFRRENDLLYDLEKGLTKVDPSGEQYLRLAECQFDMELVQACEASLAAAASLDPDLSIRADRLRKKLLGSNSEEGIRNLFGEDPCVVVDKDETAQKGVISCLSMLGAQHVVGFADAEEALDFLKGNKVSLVVCEWKFRTMTGAVFAQQVRMTDNSLVPIIVHSSLVPGDAKLLLDEAEVAGVVSKPLSNQQFIGTVTEIISQGQRPQELAAYQRKLRQLFHAGQNKKAFEIANQVLEMEKVPPEVVYDIKAQVAFAREQYDEARQYAASCIKEMGPSIFMIGLMAKCLMKLGDFDNALRFFQSADSMAPNNIARTCAVAELHSELGDDAAADEAVEKATALAPNAPIVQETQAKVALNSGNAEKAKSALASLPSVRNVVSWMNNQAVALAREGNVTESFELYERALAAMPENEIATEMMVRYNLGLAYTRANILQEAKDCLVKAAETDCSVKRKAKALLTRVEDAMKNGTKVVLRREQQESKIETDDTEIADQLLMADFGADLEPGEMALFGVFPQPDEAKKGPDAFKVPNLSAAS